MVGHQVGELLEPPQRHPGEDLALVGDRGVQHEVVRRDPVARDHQQVAVGEAVQVAHLAGVEVRGALDRRGVRDVVHGATLQTRPSGLPRTRPRGVPALGRHTPLGNVSRTQRIALRMALLVGPLRGVGGATGGRDGCDGESDGHGDECCRGCHGS